MSRLIPLGVRMGWHRASLHPRAFIIFAVIYLIALLAMVVALGGCGGP